LSKRASCAKNSWTTSYTSGDCDKAAPRLSILFVTLAYCGQTVGWIKMPLGMKVGLGPDHIMLDGDPAFPVPIKRGKARQFFVPCLLWPIGWMDQDATWYGGRPRPS